MRKRAPVPAAVKRDETPHLPRPRPPPHHPRLEEERERRLSATVKAVVVGVGLGFAALSREASYCRPPASYPQPHVADAGPQLPPVLMPPIPATAWTAGDGGRGDGSSPLPPPAPGQARPPCPPRSQEINGACWVRTSEPPPCGYAEMLWQGSCWMGLPKRPASPPISGE